MQPANAPWLEHYAEHRPVLLLGSIVVVLGVEVLKLVKLVKLFVKPLETSGLVIAS